MNIRRITFALPWRWEPHNPVLQDLCHETAYKREKGKSLLPFSVADEWACNPFFRLQESAVKEAASHWAGRKLPNDEAVFTALRRWKDSF